MMMVKCYMALQEKFFHATRLVRLNTKGQVAGNFLNITGLCWLHHHFVLIFSANGLETKISRTFLDFLHLGHEFFVISGHGT